MTPVISIKTGKKLDSYELWQMSTYRNILPVLHKVQILRLAEYLLRDIK